MIDINVEELMNEYRYEDNLFKRSLLECLHCLSEIEKKILVLYAEYNSTRMVGEIVGYSHNHIAKMLREIRIKVVQYINREDLFENE